MSAARAVPVARLAPSPTGAQHLGNARTYLLAWLWARSCGGRVVLRIEDIDTTRLRPGAAEQAVQDLRWLALDWDEGPDVGGPHGPYVQSERRGFYDAALARLAAAERIYPCTCSRADVAAAASAPHQGQEGPVYPGTCAARSAADAARLADRPFSWRFRASDRAWQFEDRVAGLRSARVASDLGDFVVARSDGTAGYQLAVVVDDHAMGVTQVLRGDDLLASTFRQLELYDALGYAPPEFAHVPLVLDPSGRRLAKRNNDIRLASLCAAGVPAARLVGLLAWSCGLQSEPAPTDAQSLINAFSLSRVARDPWVLTDELLHALHSAW